MSGVVAPVVSVTVKVLTGWAPAAGAFAVVSQPSAPYTSKVAPFGNSVGRRRCTRRGFVADLQHLKHLDLTARGGECRKSSVALSVLVSSLSPTAWCI
jgi:hypothetical protein